MATDEKRAVDKATGTETTGHDWDGITELDTPLPRWWLWCFYATIVWGLGYTIAYPAWPMISQATGGLLGYSSRAEVVEAIDAHREANSAMASKLEAADLNEIANQSDLVEFASAGGAAVFRAHCSQCHGAGAAGAKGYPNLIDDDWLWGGQMEDIRATIAHGIRWDQDDDSRFSQMPAFGDDGILSKEEIEEVTDYVLSLSGKAEATEAGAELYVDNCAACHGEAGEGLTDLGAPNLADAIWLYGGDRETVIETITHSRYGVMPAWAPRLSEAEIRQVTYYVHSLGGGQRATD